MSDGNPEASGEGAIEEPSSTEGNQEVAAAGQEPEAVDPVAQLQEELNKVKDQLLRTAADYDNFRKRTRKDLEEARRKGQEQALLEVLPVADNLERALAATGESTDVKSVVEGLQMVLKGLEDALGRLGVERMHTLGTAFDPSLHDAIQHRETDETPPGTVVEEMMPGYTLGPKLLRAAMVAVAKAPPAQTPAPERDAEGEGSSEGGEQLDG